jgi:integrase
MSAELILSNSLNAEIYLSRSGYEFDIYSDRWRLSKTIKVAVGAVIEILDPELHEGYRKSLMHLARTRSPHHAKNINERILHMLRSSSVTTITADSLISYRSTLGREHEWYMSVIRGFLAVWCDLGYVGLDSFVIQAISDWRLKGNIKGDAVNRLDPDEGPLSDLELQEFNDAVINSYEQSDVSLRDMALCLMLSSSGRRPDQIVRLRSGDILDPDVDQYNISIPRAKQRGVAPRKKFKKLRVIRELWAILRAQANSSVKTVCDSIGLVLPEDIKRKIPVFLDVKAALQIKDLSKLRLALESDVLEARVSLVSEVAKKVIRKSGLISHRTEDILSVNPRRFKYTVGTRAAREGFGVMVIAELLDHSDTQSAGVYVKNIPDHIERLDQAVARHLAPYAQAFSGVLVDSEEDAARGDDLRSRIHSSQGGVGSCGSYGFCGANVPLPCYTCIHFQPWLDGPHVEILDFLVLQRENIIATTGDKTIAAVNDRTILAVANVIQLCDERRTELSAKGCN